MSNHGVQAIPPETSEAAAMAAIVTWSAECPSWQRDALRRLCAQGQLERADHDALLALCKSEGTAAVPLTANHVRDPSAGAAVVTLNALRDLQHVNALADGERLSFEKAGVTIIYGDNGAGKSGYARVLKKVCRARSPENEKILSNVYAANVGVPTAVIDFRVGGQNHTATWGNGQSSDARLSAVSVFDWHSASIHVDQSNDVAYTPLPLQILAGLAQVCQEMKARLTAEINPPLQGLDARLLVYAHDDSIGRRVEVDVYNFVLLLLEVGVVAGKPVLDAVRLDVRSPEPQRHCLRADGGNDSSHHQLTCKEVHRPSRIGLRWRPDDHGENFLGVAFGKPVH